MKLMSFKLLTIIVATILYSKISWAKDFPPIWITSAQPSNNMSFEKCQKSIKYPFGKTMDFYSKTKIFLLKRKHQNCSIFNPPEDNETEIIWCKKPINKIYIFSPLQETCLIASNWAKEIFLIYFENKPNILDQWNDFR